MAASTETLLALKHYHDCTVFVLPEYLRGLCEVFTRVSMCGGLRLTPESLSATCHLNYLKQDLSVELESHLYT